MKLKHLSMSFLVFTVLTFLAIVYRAEPLDPGSVKSADIASQAPVFNLPNFENINSAPSLTATGVYAFDVETGKVLYSKNADLLVSPASTTKVMTALTAIDVMKLNEIVNINIPKIDGQKMHLFSGEKMSVESLLYGLLVFSANDAAEAIARAYPGGRDAFIEAMNIKARGLGLTLSVFKNPSGLDQSGHLSTAYEMGMLGKAIMKNDILRNIVGTKNAVVTSLDAKYVHKLSSTNELLAAVPGVMGIKTGWTEESHENLITYVDRGHPIIISLFGSDDRFGETKKLIDWVYKNYTWEK